jgi:NADH-quinone oxidoreductase subunit A
MNVEFHQFLPIFMLVVVAIGFACVGIGAPMLIGKKRTWGKVKDTAYECGLPSDKAARVRFSVKFYLVAMIFILFDLEVVFVVGWASVFKEIIKSVGPSVLWGMLAFLVILEIGHLYIWRQGALDWAPKRSLNKGES